MIWCAKGIGSDKARPRHGGAKTVRWTVFSGERARTPVRPGLRRKTPELRRACAACRTAGSGPVVRMQWNESAQYGLVLPFFARNQGAHAPPGRARPPPGWARLRAWPAELWGEGVRDKAPRTRLGAPSRGRARSCGGIGVEVLLCLPLTPHPLTRHHHPCPCDPRRLRGLIERRRDL
jgi:hypothetical protein